MDVYKGLLTLRMELLVDVIEGEQQKFDLTAVQTASAVLGV